MSRHFCPHTEQTHLRNTDISNKRLVIFLHTDYNTLCSCDSSGLIFLKEWNDTDSDSNYKLMSQHFSPHTKHFSLPDLQLCISAPNIPHLKDFVCSDSRWWILRAFWLETNEHCICIIITTRAVAFWANNELLFQPFLVSTQDSASNLWPKTKQKTFQMSSMLICIFSNWQFLQLKAAQLNLRLDVGRLGFPSQFLERSSQ